MFKQIQYKYENSDQLRNQLQLELKTFNQTNNPTIEDYENIILLLMQQIFPFIELLLKFNSMEMIQDLSNSFSYIEKHRKNRIEPLEELEQYVELCNDAGLICGECEEAERYSEEEIIQMQNNWYDEIEEKREEMQTVAHYAFNFFGAYYYFLSYFAYDTPDLESAREYCESMVDEILFDILWEMDFDLKKKESESYCVKAINELLSICRI